jgi:hypothetical protein
MKTRALLLVLLATALLVPRADAEPIFLSRQYARCTTCHYSPTGGGLLTPYGRSLTRQELSTMGGGHAAAPGPQAPPPGEESFLFGALGDRLGPVNLGIDLRPAHLDIRFPGGSFNENLLMNADISAAYQAKGWTVYGEFGRQPLLAGTRVASFEHWVSHQSANGIGVRVGRFLPAYGIHFADHTAYNRAPLGLNTFDQIYGVELSHTTDRHLIELTAGPGRADSLIHNDDDGLRAFTASARVQMDLTTRTVLVLSGLFHDEARLNPRNGSGGVSFGIAPTGHLTIWTEGDVQFQRGATGAPAYSLVNETSYEIYRGVWIKVSPQIRTDFGDTSGGLFRWAFELNLLPRTHWNVDLSYYRDRGRLNDIVTKTALAQLHLYL